jgi:tetratricopeptide (TPR) repeat protein
MFMKKRRKNILLKDNIFLFPNVEKLLMEKGLEKLKSKNYSEAIRYLKDAKEIDQDNEEIDLGLILAYFESNKLQEAKLLAQENLHKGFGDYFQLIDIYIMILLQLNEYEEIVTTIQALIDEREIPVEKLDNFKRILEFSTRKLNSDNHLLQRESFDERVEFDLFQLEDLNEQFLAVANLAHTNVRVYLAGIKEYLHSPKGHPFVKTMLLQLLKEQEVNEELLLEKFQQTTQINPIKLAELEVYLENPEISKIIQEQMEQSNPTLYDNMKDILHRHSFLLFPLKRTPSNPIIWAAAYHFIALEYHGETVSVEKLARKYQVDPTELDRAIVFIRKLEEISSPII